MNRSRDNKEIQTKEKTDRQLAGQTSSTPFMNIQEEHNKRFTFNMKDSFEHKIDKLMVLRGKVVMKDNGQNRKFKLQVYQNNTDRGKQDIIINSEVFKTGLGQTVAGTIHLEEDQGMDKIIEVDQGII